MKRFGTLLLALLAGFLVAAMLDRRDATSADETADSPRRSPAVADASSSKGDVFSQAWRTLAEQEDLSRSQRREAKRTLLMEWASADPRHLLRFFEGRALPYGWDDCLGVIAATQPELVVQFARDHGSLKALRLLVERMDPRKALETVAAEPGTPPELFATIARRGTAADPDFAGHLADLPEGPAREQFINGVIETDLAMSRWKKACALASLIEEKERATALLGEYLASLPDGAERSELLLGLTNDLRGPVLAKLVERLAMRDETFDLRELKAFAEELAEENSDEGLARVLARMAPAARVEVERVLAEPPEDASAE
jgi:hypothetical protein